MKKVSFLFLAVLSLFIHFSAKATEPKPVEPKVVGFCYGPVNDFQYEKLTHIIYHLVEFEDDGTIRTKDLRDFAAKAHKHGVKAIVSFLGKFGQMSDNADNSRVTFIQNMFEFVSANNLDGVDYDWEGPELTDTERVNYGLLVKETHDMFKPYGYSVSIDTCWRKELNPPAIKYLDWVNCMAYDGGWPNHSSFQRGIDLLKTWEIGKKTPRGKLLWGTGFYARDKNNGSMPYKRIVELYDPLPEADMADKWGYPGIETTKKKTQYVLDNGYGGMMIWNLDHDTYDDRSLLKAIDDTIKSYAQKKALQKYDFNNSTPDTGEDNSNVLRLVSKYEAVWTAPPGRTPANHSVDGPLMGNGDLGVCLGKRPDHLRNQGRTPVH